MEPISSCPPEQDTNQSLREPTFLDHCRMVLAPLFGAHVEFRQCIRQVSQFQQVLLALHLMLENLDRQSELILFASRERSHHVQQPSDCLLIANNPLVRPEIASDVSDPSLHWKPRNIFTMGL